MTRRLACNIRFQLALLLAVVGSLLTMSVTEAKADAPSAGRTMFVSTIMSLTHKTCVDVPGGTSDINTDLVMATCDGSPQQTFHFGQVTSTSSIYHIRSVSSGLCIHDYRFTIRQFYTCTAVSHPSDLEWVLHAISGKTHQYQLEPRFYVGSSEARCAAGHASGGLTLDFCNPAAAAGQTFVIAGAPY